MPSKIIMLAISFPTKIPKSLLFYCYFRPVTEISAGFLLLPNFFALTFLPTMNNANFFLPIRYDFKSHTFATWAVSVKFISLLTNTLVRTLLVGADMITFICVIYFAFIDIWTNINSKIFIHIPSQVLILT